MGELNSQHQPIPTPRSQRKKVAVIIVSNAFLLLLNAIFFKWNQYIWIVLLLGTMAIVAAVLAWNAYPFLFRIKATAVLGLLPWIFLWGCSFVAILLRIPMDASTRLWIAVSAQSGLLLTAVASIRACWSQHKRMEKRRFRSINFKTMEYDFMRDSFKEEPIDFVVWHSSPLYRLLIPITLALSGGPALVILANKFSQFMYYSIGALAAWASQLLFLAVLIPISVDAYVIYKLEKKHGKPLRMVVPSRKRKRQ